MPAIYPAIPYLYYDIYIVYNKSIYFMFVSLTRLLNPDTHLLNTGYTENFIFSFHHYNGLNQK
ncbi:hypothetical protein AC068_08120 [Morganella morganii]|nr:hypothetical protein AC068_08120 [Morganella morganii]